MEAFPSAAVLVATSMGGSGASMVGGIEQVMIRTQPDPALRDMALPVEQHGRE